MLVVLEPCLAVRRQATQSTFDKAYFLIFYAEYNKNTSSRQFASWFFPTLSSIERQPALERGGGLYLGAWSGYRVLAGSWAGAPLG